MFYTETGKFCIIRASKISSTLSRRRATEMLLLKRFPSEIICGCTIVHESLIIFNL